ncbi:MAG: hypothetical protein GF308_01280 [Candidatus Heimdallarchaeota archaeon]|nr:hypothetical protein [Candidatus Heimdallarchaeota archaeon]
MANILINGKKYIVLDFDNEQEFEEAVIENYKHLFGRSTIYIDVKIRVGKKDSYHKTIPDGFLIDFTNRKKPQLYFVENELSSHDVYGHIAEQVLRFSTAIKTRTTNFRKKLLENIKSNPQTIKDIESFGSAGGFNNVDEIVNYLLDNPIKIVVVIDEATTDLYLSLNELKNTPDTVLMQRFWNGEKVVYLYEPFREELNELDDDLSSDSTIDEFDTIVCAAREDGFIHAFMENDAWWEVRLSQKAREQLKYLAIYEKSPVAEIKHLAEIDRIEPYKNSGKYIIYLKNKRKIAPIKLDKDNKFVAPRPHRYTTYEKLLKARKISELW